MCSRLIHIISRLMRYWISRDMRSATGSGTEETEMNWNSSISRIRNMQTDISSGQADALLEWI